MTRAGRELANQLAQPYEFDGATPTAAYWDRIAAAVLDADRQPASDATQLHGREANA